MIVAVFVPHFPVRIASSISLGGRSSVVFMVASVCRVFLLSDFHSPKKSLYLQEQNICMDGSTPRPPFRTHRGCVPTRRRGRPLDDRTTGPQDNRSRPASLRGMGHRADGSTKSTKPTKSTKSGLGDRRIIGPSDFVDCVESVDCVETTGGGELAPPRRPAPSGAWQPKTHPDAHSANDPSLTRSEHLGLCVPPRLCVSNQPAHALRFW